ncbi:MAG: exodeoxyribonuclease V subunit beta [Betaproteobacteria bacterium]
MTERLDVVTLPLRGSRVIEASAGTGKTWTLAALVLRLVLGDGVARPLHPREILVMSFTQAATRELVERIRERLAQAALAFRAAAADEPADPVLRALLQARPGAAEREAAARLLGRAADAMDEAAVHTIDAWCQRVLREHAFDSGSRFDEELVADESELRRQALRDWWRAEVYPLQSDALARVLAQWKDVQALEKQLGPLLKLGDARLATGDEGLEPLCRRKMAELRALKAGWMNRCEALRAWFAPRTVSGRSDFDGEVIRPNWVKGWLDKIQAWALDPDAEEFDLKTGRERLLPATVQAAFKPGRASELPVELSDYAALQEALDRREPLRAALLRHAHAQVSARLQAQKRRASLAGFADLQRRLSDALDPAQRGEAAARLRAQVLDRYPVALVDECQDSSPVQMALFERLWGFGHDEPGRTLLLIGDPKQSIYRFRGADIHGFLRARQAAGARVHGLDTNFRSTPELVAAVNAVFERAEAERQPEGAFRFGADDAGRPRRPVHPVRARGRADRITVAGAPMPPLTVALDRGAHPTGEARLRLAAACAEQIVAWLSDPGTRVHDPRDAAEPERALRPRDIAVLVRNKAEADAVRRALGVRAVRSVYLSEKDSVFAEPEAADLLRLLRAVADPADGRAVRAALASAWMGLPLDELCALADDDARFEARVERLLPLRATWRQQGVLAALRQALHTLVAPDRWARPGGERTLTNTLHLAELLQAAAEHQPGEAELLRWLGREIDESAEGDSAPDEQLLRLESDADLVPIVTVHKSKGLQYRVVCVPFASLASRPRSPAFVVQPADEATVADGRRAVVFAPDAAARAADEAEQAREALRLLYVALTRAEHALWLGVAAALQVNGKGTQPTWQRSALGWLVSGDNTLDDAAVAAAVERWAGALPHARLVPAWPGADAGDGAGAEPPRTRWADRQPVRPLRPPRPLPAQPPAAWAVGSYSGFVRGLADAAPARGWRDDEPPAEASGPFAPAPRGAPWHRFPRGTGPGQLLHEQLEWLAGERFALAREPALAAQLRARLERQAPDVNAGDVVDWLGQVCDTPVPVLGAALSALPRTWPELEFWLPTEALDAARVDALCRRHVLPGLERPALPPRRLRGLLMGFADLVFETPDGRFGVLDHKSNSLGDGDAAYTDEALAQAVLQHRYDVQGALYLVALHRLLRQRLGARYQPAAQLHGATFLFLRGIAAPGAGAWHLVPVPALLDELDAMFSAATGRAA